MRAVLLVAAVLAAPTSTMWSRAAEPPALPSITVTIQGKSVQAAKPPPGSDAICIDFNARTGKVERMTWTTGGFDHVVIGDVKGPDGAEVAPGGVDELAIDFPGGGPTTLSVTDKPPPGSDAICIDFNARTGKVERMTWTTGGFDHVVIGDVKAGGNVLDIDGNGRSRLRINFGQPSPMIEVLPGNLPKRAVVPGLAGDSSTATDDPPPAPPPKAPVLKTLGCPSMAKVNQLVLCQSDGAPGDAHSPVTLLKWHAPGGVPDIGFDGIVFLTQYAEPGVKQISLKACSGDECTTLSQNVMVTADAPSPEIVPAEPSGVQCINGFAGPLVVWTDNSNNEIGFRVFQQTETAPVLVGTEAANITSHNLPEGDCNSAPYGVASHNSAGQSAVVWQTS